MGIAVERIRLVRHFVRLAEGRPNTEVGSYGAFVGRLSAEKGLDVLLRACIAPVIPPFLIVGDGPRMEALDGLSRQLGLAHTKFVGRRRGTKSVD